MRISKYTVIYDACVLYPAPLRDLLLTLASSGLFRARWTNDIHDEWMRNLIKNRPDLDESRLARTKQLMNRAVLDCLVEGYQDLIPSLHLPDENDRHVLAAAIKCAADGIITFNRRDFPAVEVDTYEIEVQHPDDFLLAQFDLDEAAVINAIHTCRKRLKKPEKTGEEYLDTLEQQSLPKFVNALRPWTAII
ncbi:PIN domain-containing protein [Aurantimonas sp. E1-2-R+4]|uniref:PIN domain-containing protein n=1 Tax=Aurantimonas sp. E1-2-R+4 TaxID=3113714 RepID=UPI002F949241